LAMVPLVETYLINTLKTNFLSYFYSFPMHHLICESLSKLIYPKLETLLLYMKLFKKATLFTNFF